MEEHHLLPAAADCDQTAFSRSFGLKGIFFNFLEEQPVQVVLQGDTAMLFLIICGRESGPRAVHLHAETGRGSEGIPLYMVDVQEEASKGIASLQILVGRITFMVHCPQHAS